MSYTVVFAPEAEEQLAELYRCIAIAGSREIARKYTDAVPDYCDGLATFPQRVALRDDLRPAFA